MMWIKPLIVCGMLAYAGWLLWRARGFAKKPFVDPAWGCERLQDFNHRQRAIRLHDFTAYTFIFLALLFGAYVRI